MKREHMNELDKLIEQYYSKSKRAGEHFYLVFPDEHKGKTQMRSLENIVCATTRPSEVKNFIKNQMGKDSGRNARWTMTIPGENRMLGDIMLDQVEELEEYAEKVTGVTEKDFTGVKMRLLQAWIRQVATSYFYQLAQKEQKNEH